MSYTKDRDEFITTIIDEVVAKQGNTGDGMKLALLILRRAATLQRLAVNDCNRGLTEAEKRNDALCEKRISEACQPWGIVPNFNGDPRGAVVKLLLPSGKYNSFGGREDGYCVPTRDC